MPSVSAPESRFPETANLSRCEDNKIIPNITHTCINVHINGTFNLLCRIVFRGAGQCFCRTCMVGRGGMEVAGVPSRDGLGRAGRTGTGGTRRTGTDRNGRGWNEWGVAEDL